MQSTAAGQPAGKAESRYPAAVAAPSTAEPRAQLWSLVREISARLASVPADSDLYPFADKLSRLKALNERCTKYETQLKYVTCSRGSSSSSPPPSPLPPCS
jgi:hypothetical protein